MTYVEKLAVLEGLFGTDPQAFREKAFRAFDRIAGAEHPSIVLYGAGGLGQRVARGLRKVGLEPIAFADGNEELQGRTVLGIPVFHPAEAARRFSQEAVFVISIWRSLASESMHQRRSFLASLGCTRICSVFSLFLKFPDIFLPYYSADEPHKVITAAAEIRLALDLMADESSRMTLIDHILWRLDPDRHDLNTVSQQTEYFPEDLFRLHDHEVYVDCGGYDGDTARRFLDVARGQFAAIHIVEPDSHNFSRIEHWRSQLPANTSDRIHALNCAASNRRGTIAFSSNSGLDSRIAQNGATQIPCDALDSLLGGIHPTIVKMDIEGSESLALQGAKGIIQRFRPILSICLYHIQADAWSIPLMIRRFSDGYRFYVKAHSLDGWDLVLYAVPAERAKAVLAN